MSDALPGETTTPFFLQSLVAWGVGIGLFAAALSFAPTTIYSRLHQPCLSDDECPPSSRCLQVPSVCTPVIPKPSHKSTLLAATGVRRPAAADLAWMQAVQHLGSPHTLHSDYAGLEDWLFQVIDLDPSEELTYMTGGILLSTFPDRADAADRLLALGETNLGANWEFAMWRGFVAYFSKLDNQAAAQHFARAAELGAPPVVAARAETLRRHQTDCRSVLAQLRMTQREMHQHGAVQSAAGADERVLMNCYERHLNQLLQARRTANLPPLTSLRELVDEGRIETLPALPAGKCWVLRDGTVHADPCTP